MSIRAHLFLIVFVVALPAAGIIIDMGLKLRKEVITQARLDTQKIVDRIATEQQNLVTGAEQLMTAVAQLPEVKHHETAKVEPILRELAKLNPMYSNIAIADRNGTVWATAVHLKSPYIADRRFFKNALASGRMSSGEYVVSRSTSKPAFHFAYPFKGDHGDIAGVISVGFILDRYQELLGRMQAPAGTNAVLIDHRGIILSRAVNPEPFIGKEYFPEIFKKIQEGPEIDTSVRAGLVGDMRIISYNKLHLKGEQAPYMYATAGIPVESVLKHANSTLLYNVMLLMSVLMAAFILAWRIGKRSIVDRVALLEQASQQLAKGDLDVRVSDHVVGGELGNLSKTFDTMARQLTLREQALRESESNYRDIYNATHDALFVHKAESGEIVEVNTSAEEMFGYDHEEILHVAVSELSAGEPPYSYKEAMQWIQKSVIEGPQKFEWLSKRKTGELFWTEIVISALSIAEKSRVLAVVRDITDRKEMDSVKDGMLSAVSHEMRSPLTAMLGFLELVMENPVDEASMRYYHGIMYKEAVRLNKLINRFLDMQHFKAKHGDLIFKPLAVRPLMEEAMAIFASPSCTHRIIVDSPAGLPRIYGDEELLHQTLTNLLSNAIKYSPNDCEIILGARCEGNIVTLWVKDNGMGIPAGSLDKVFELFYRVDNTARRMVGGTGLGLALVKEIVGVHGGKVWVESTLGKGSTFYITLPVVRDDSGIEKSA